VEESAVAVALISRAKGKHKKVKPLPKNIRGPFIRDNK
jgi:hypothetical protein